MFSLCGAIDNRELCCTQCSGQFSDENIHIAWAGAPHLQHADSAEQLGRRLAQAYQRESMSFVRGLDGHFALAVLDKSQGAWTLAADAAGVIPLYYVKSGEHTLFSTRIADLLVTLTEARLNPEALLDYLAFFWTLDDKTFFDGVHLLPQGGLLSSSGMARHFSFQHRPAPGGSETWNTAIESRLQKAIEGLMTLRTGVHLSGGIDSSFIAALAAECCETAPPAYAVAFPGFEAYDESPFGEAVARHHNMSFVRAPVEADAFPASLGNMMRAIEEPKCHPPVFARFMLEHCSSLDQCDRIMTGRGADELFTGYDAHRPQALDAHRDRRAVFSPLDRQRLLTGDFLRACDYSPEQRYEEVHEQCASRDTLEGVLAIDYMGLMKNWLVVDYKISRHFGADCVAPFLTRPMIDLALSIPLEQKHAGDQLKIVLKAAAASRLPKTLLTRAKVGFRTPMTEMFRQDALASYLRDRLQRDNSVFWDYFDAQAVTQQLDGLLNKNQNLGWQLWALLCIREWFRIFLEEREWQE